MVKDDNSNRILFEKYYALAVKLVSPLSISVGSGSSSKFGLFRDLDGQLFVPGTSLAGVFRSYLRQEKDHGNFMGFVKGNSGMMSCLVIKDMFIEDACVGVRETAKQGKAGKGVFQVEIVESGAKAVIYMHYTIRTKSKYKKEEYDAYIHKLIYGIQSGEIRIGYKKNRGFGRLEIENIYTKELEMTEREKIDENIEFKHNPRNLSLYDEKKSYEDFKYIYANVEEQYIRLQFPLKLCGGISIRMINGAKLTSEHVKCNGVSVVPGNSWGGIFRRGSIRILAELLDTQEDSELVQKLVEQWFGSNRRASLIVIGDSIIEDRKSVV